MPHFVLYCSVSATSVIHTVTPLNLYYDGVCFVFEFYMLDELSPAVRELFTVAIWIA